MRVNLQGLSCGWQQRAAAVEGGLRVGRLQQQEPATQTDEGNYALLLTGANRGGGHGVKLGAKVCKQDAAVEQAEGSEEVGADGHGDDERAAGGKGGWGLFVRGLRF